MRPLLLILFAKAPEPGRVKTRLIPRLTAERAAELHRAMVGTIWRNLQGLGPVQLQTDVATEAWPEIAERRVQRDGDLGERMRAAMEAGLGAGYAKALVIGGDSPGLPAEHLRELQEADADVALGPTADGGYYAICCRRTEARMFEGVRWSTAEALADTIAAARRCGLSVYVGRPWFDIDEPEDLERLRAFAELAEFAE